VAWTQADIDALKDAIKTGVRSVSYSDRSVTYQSIDEMLKVLSAMEAEAQGSTTPTPGRSTFASFSRG